MGKIVQAPDGAYVDLSKIVAVSPITDQSIGFSYFKVGFNFDVYFTPEGVPFKQDNCFKIAVSREINQPQEITDLYAHYNGFGSSAPLTTLNT